MPGALTRVANSPMSSVVSMQSGGGSKDTWVLSDGPVSPVTLLAPAGQTVALERAPADLPSRVADNLFWLGRYAERSENLVRLLRSVVRRLPDEAGREGNAAGFGLVSAPVKRREPPQKPFASLAERETLARNRPH